MAKKKDNKAEIQTIIERTNANIAVNIEENYIFTTEDKVKICTTNITAQGNTQVTFWRYWGFFFHCSFQS